MKAIIWLSNESEIPKYGVVTSGSEKTLPDKMADSFVERGLAKFKPEAKSAAKGKPVSKEEK